VSAPTVSVPAATENGQRIWSAWESNVSGEWKLYGSTILVITGVPQGTNQPEGFRVFQNYPNPFNPSTTIKFEVTRPGRVCIVVSDVLGRTVRTIVDETFQSGVHETVWNGKNDNGVSVSSGVYSYRMTTEGGSLKRRMVLLR
jgi:hypothetical protein